MKRYSYKQVTQNTEQCIKEFMAKAREIDDGKNDFTKWLYIGWANGAFLTWSSLTKDDQTDWDYMRLSVLTHFECDVPL